MHHSKSQSGPASRQGALCFSPPLGSRSTRSSQVSGGQPYLPAQHLPTTCHGEGWQLVSILGQMLSKFPAKGHCPGRVTRTWVSLATTTWFAFLESPSSRVLSLSVSAKYFPRSTPFSLPPEPFDDVGLAYFPPAMRHGIYLSALSPLRSLIQHQHQRRHSP